MQESECKYCHKKFEYSKEKANRAFCNETCRKLYYGIKEKKTEMRVCSVCGNTFVWSSSVPNKKYCGKECAKAAQASRLKVIEVKYETHYCQRCGAPFEWTSKKSNQIFCSEKCRTDQWVEKNRADVAEEIRKCAVCKKKFIWVSSKSNQKYCSAECRHIAQLNMVKSAGKTKKERLLDEIDEFVSEIVTIIINKGKENGENINGRLIDYWYIGDISESTRENVLKRDNHQCRICSRGTNLHLHHIIKRCMGGNHSEDNLITLCASCHRHIETGDIEHAIKACAKNRRKYYEIYDDSMTKDETILQALYVLKNIYSELSNKWTDESELLIRMDNVISNLEDIGE